VLSSAVEHSRIEFRTFDLEYLNQGVNVKRDLSFLLGVCLLVTTSAVAESWNLPEELSTENTRVTFEVDSTWHLVHGVVKEVAGRLWLANPEDFHSIRGIVKLPVAGFDTDDESRDERLREVMHSDLAPSVIFEMDEDIPKLCDPGSLTESSSCELAVPGRLTINNVSRAVELRVVLKRSGSSIDASGGTKIKWSDFGVDDPSIFVARLHEEVNISFQVLLTSEENK
jgi:polyisoprenoid-binding protein YceI